MVPEIRAANDSPAHLITGTPWLVRLAEAPDHLATGHARAKLVLVM